MKKFEFIVQVSVKGKYAKEVSERDVRSVLEDAIIGEEFVMLTLGDGLTEGDYGKIEVKILRRKAEKKQSRGQIVFAGGLHDL